MHHCPSCKSLNVWADTYHEKTYRHCLDCTFDWDAQAEGTRALQIEANEYIAKLEMSEAYEVEAKGQPCLIFIDWKFASSTTEDGEHWHWAEFYFQSEDGELVAESPMYLEGASDFYCLREDTLEALHRLKSGASWEDVAKSFRQAW